MEIRTIKKTDKGIAIVHSDAELISDVQSALDFIYESNKGKDIFFLSDEKQAIEKFGMS